jgi:hypothetical protein
MFRQNVIEGMLSDPAYGGNRDMVGWKWIGFPGDPMARGDVYYKYIFTDKPYPYEDKPRGLQQSSLKITKKGAAAAPNIAPTSSNPKGGM